MCTKHEKHLNRLSVALLLAAALILSACGGSEETTSEMPFPAADQAPVADDTPDQLKAKVRKKKQRAGTVEKKDFEAKPEWDMLRPHFDKFAEALEEEIHNPSVTWKYKDAFADRMEKFYPPEEAPKGPMLDLAKANTGPTKEEKKEDKTIESILAGIVPPENEGSEVASEVTDLGTKGPLEKFPLDNYVFRIIMTGVASPEALVEDPDGLTHVVRLNDKIGSEGGHVVDIFKHKVYVRVPDQVEPVEVSLAPATLPGTFASQ